MSRALDPAEILAQIDEMTSGQSYQQSATDTSRSQPAAEARPRSQGAEGAMQSGSDAFARAAEWSAARRGLSTAPFGTTRKDYRAGANTGARPVSAVSKLTDHAGCPCLRLHYDACRHDVNKTAYASMPRAWE